MSINYVFTFRLILTHPKCSAKINEQRCRFKRPYWSGLEDIGPWFWRWRRTPITFWAKFSPTRILFMFWWMDFHASKLKNKILLCFFLRILLETSWKSSAMANISLWWTRLTYNCAHLRSTKESLTMEYFEKEIFWVKII